MSAQNVARPAVEGESAVREALTLLENALALLDDNRAPMEIRARLCEVFEALATYVA
jgi:hypothetical protein